MQDSGERNVFGYWGKAQGEGWHLLPYHCLDVAACAVALIRRNERIRSVLMHLTRVDAPSLESLVGWSAAIHDLGKFSPAFQWKVPAVAQALGASVTTITDDVRHDNLGWGLWFDHIERTLIDDPEARKAARLLAGCATGHHGVPPSRLPNGRPLYTRRYFDTGDLKAAQEWAAWCFAWFKPELSAINVECLKEASWWIAGVITLADWLGSSTEWFPYLAVPDDLVNYWTGALIKSQSAIDDSGLGSKRCTRTFSELFPSYQPSPIQAAVIGLEITPGALLIIEEAAGGGKTEAALAAAGGDSFFFGLPSMATANGLWARVGDIGGQQTLLHGKRWLLPDSMARVEAWINDSSRKAMLAQIGVGTVDQAMLAVLYSRFSALRLIGLAGRTLIIDEVHAYDPYMTEVLLRLVEFHARAGGSVVLLSATMALAIRQQFVAAWAAGRKLPSPIMSRTEFPLVSYADSQGCQQVAVSSYRAQRLIVQRESKLPQVIDRIHREASAGKCVVWIRNTVREAVEAYDSLHSQGLDVDLFHARFTSGDRSVIEQRVLKQFGKCSCAEERAGKVLVATQVVEQSLDIDFDFMVTDLAPVDLMIQRAGRLHRHMRGDRGEAILLVFAPEWSDEPNSDWVRRWSPGVARVYPDHGRLWLTLKVLGAGFDLPTDSRKLIEGVYGELTMDVPSGLSAVSDRAAQLRATMALTGNTNVLSAQAVYVSDGAPVWDEEHAPSRLGQATREWVLCANGQPIGGTVALSTVSLRSNLLSDAPGAPGVRVGPWQKTLLLTDGRASGTGPRGNPLQVYYDRRRGMSWL